MEKPDLFTCSVQYKNFYRKENCTNPFSFETNGRKKEEVLVNWKL